MSGIKPIGKLQLQILEYIGEHPKTLVQPISNALGKKAYYANVNENIHILTERDLLTQDQEVKSEKGASYPSYTLTLKGASYVYAFSNNEVMILNTVKRMEAKEDLYIQFQHLIDSLPRKTALKLIRQAGNANLTYGDGFWGKQISLKLSCC